jgi:predicted MFS family arabinose efflux permease
VSEALTRADGPSSTARYGVGFWLVAAAFAAGMAFSTVPTPLYSLYQEQDKFSTAMVTVIFAFYAVGVLLSLFLAGHVSDWLGRRRLLAQGLITQVVSAVVFLVWNSLPGLLLARLICGIGVGLITATATAYLSELHSAARPNAARTRADLVATAANLGGLSLGPLIAGALAQFVVAPLQVPYWAFIAALLLALSGLLLVPETVHREHRPYRPQRVSVPPAARGEYFGAAAAAFVALALMGLFTGLSSSFISGTMHQHSELMAGLPSFLVFFTSAVGQILLGRRSPLRLFAIGLPLLVAGLAITTAAVWIPSLLVFLVGGAVAGSAVGLLFKAAISSAISLAAPEAKGEAAAGIFTVAYVGLTLPVVLVGVAARVVSLQTAMTGCAAVMVLACAVLGVKLLRQPQGAQRGGISRTTAPDTAPSHRTQ